VRERGGSMLRVRLRTPPPWSTSSTATSTGSSAGLLLPPAWHHCSPCHSRSAMCSRVHGDFGRAMIQIAPTPVVVSTWADTTVSTRRGIHQGWGSSPASTRRTTPRRNDSHRGPVHRACAHACMRLRSPACDGIKRQAAEVTPHSRPCDAVGDHVLRRRRSTSVTAMPGRLLLPWRHPGCASFGRVLSPPSASDVVPTPETG